MAFAYKGTARLFRLLRSIFGPQFSAISLSWLKFGLTLFSPLGSTYLYLFFLKIFDTLGYAMLPELSEVLSSRLVFLRSMSGPGPINMLKRSDPFFPCICIINMVSDVLLDGSITPAFVVYLSALSLRLFL